LSEGAATEQPCSNTSRCENETWCIARLADFE
jgi:hypothetical protein